MTPMEIFKKYKGMTAVIMDVDWSNESKNIILKELWEALERQSKKENENA
jgi:hypothetical protein